MTVYLRALVDGEGLVREVAEPFKFPGGEVHLKNIRDFGYKHAVWIADVRGASGDDLMTAAMLRDVALQRGDNFVLMLPYLPAARADRGVPFGAGVYAEQINSMFAHQVIGIDPHSPVITRQISALTWLEPFPLIQRALMSRRYDGVIAPDAGAVQRSGAVAKHLGIGLYRAEKKRDFETGEILGIEMVDSLPSGGRYLVVDDICDGGGTFKGLAKATGLASDRLSLWVTHGIFSGNAHELRQYYRQIYTTDSHPGHNRVGVATTVVPTQTYMLSHVKGF